MNESQCIDAIWPTKSLLEQMKHVFMSTEGSFKEDMWVVLFAMSNF